MRYISRKKSKDVGLPPGSLVYQGEKRSEDVKITVIDYSEKSVQEMVTKNVEDCFPFKDQPSVTWINIDGLHKVDIIEKIGEHFDLHPLVLEDILNISQRPKTEDFENYIYTVLKMFTYNKQENETNIEQVSIVIGSNFVISFQEKEGDIFDPVRDRIRFNKGHIRKMKSDYLAYSLIDTVVDNYFIVLEEIGEQIESVEDELSKNPDPEPETLQTIHGLKRDVLFLRKSIWPLREVINTLNRNESRLIYKTTQLFLKDVYDHVIQTIETLDTYREMLTSMLDLYLSSINNRMNEVMKVLTIIATVFIPLTFIAGIYGMNFEYMPELYWKWSYPILWMIMVSASLFMFAYFKKKKWL
ncbi:magnesium and cobalt transport protein CorA [Methanohalobium evestigatum Z-7303]|uniref:Magnesium transport protein CorA n=1 Tax=Methanohalobium evestigatum (strain ATCC BAA-1072 / DSM 3721 / NBRC 107634 / OCM 161 / Z-7303) TaxID=644295 RepID=D7E9F3_METEZ|nr:magnesium/cobalt transporter CorA [Methanohalobium evestigatum]ADI74225.1 magnesium and cobalt transport protein CorA [Methanohalobium evestigatum Z-7303]